MAYDNYLNLAITWCEIDIRRMDAVRDFTSPPARVDSHSKWVKILKCTVLCEIGFTPDTLFFKLSQAFDRGHWQVSPKLS